jgi:hypothetical protein
MACRGSKSISSETFVELGWKSSRRSRRSSASSSGADVTNRLPRWAVPIVAVAGVVLLAALVLRLGPSTIAWQLSRLAPILPVVLALGALKYTLQTIGWRLVLHPTQRPRWPDAIRATVAGDAVGYLTWAGPFSGEPTRAVLTRHLVPVGPGIAAGAAERAMYSLTSAALVVSVATTLAVTTPAAGRVMVVIGCGLLLLAGAWALARRWSPAATASMWQPPYAAVRTFWVEHRGAAPVLGVLCLAQHVALIVEAWLMLDALGAIPTVRETIVFEAVTKLVNTAGLAVPGRVGIAEGGSALLAGALGYEASIGLSLALMRRTRALIWAAIGLLLLVGQERRARRAAAEAGR